MDNQYSAYPYQMPPTAPQEPTVFPTGGPVPCPSSLANLSSAIAMLRQDFGSWAGATAVLIVVYSAVYGALSFAVELLFGELGIIGSESRVPYFIASFLALLIGYAALYMLLGGLQRMIILRMRGYSTSLTDMFNLNGTAGSLVGFGVIISAILGIPTIGFLYWIESVVASDTPEVGPALAGMLIGYGLYIVYTWIVYAFLAQAPAIIVDQRKGPFAAAGLSIQVMAPRWYASLGVTLLGGFLAGIGVLLCCFGIFLTAPIFSLLVAVFYFESFIRPTMPVPESTFTSGFGAAASAPTEVPPPPPNPPSAP